MPRQPGRVWLQTRRPLFRLRAHPLSLSSSPPTTCALQPGETDNLTTLSNLNEETLLHELKVRYNKDVIYVRFGWGRSGCGGCIGPRGEVLGLVLSL